MALPLCRLYLITPPRLDDLAAFGHVLARALDAGDVAAVQIRLKDQPDEIIAAAVDVLAPIARIPFRLNHRLMMRHGEAGLRAFMAGYGRAKAADGAVGRTSGDS